MHLSMLSPGEGWGGYGNFNCEGCPKRGDFDRTRYSLGGKFDMTTIFDNEEDFEIKL